MVDFDSTVTFLGFELFEDAALPARYTGAISVQTADGRSVPIVPEPGTALLFGAGLAALRGARRPR